METKSRVAKVSFVPGSAKSSRNLRTFALQMAKAKERVLDLERGNRLRTLRAGRRQAPIAAFVGVTVRAYQMWEAGGGMLDENIELLATWFNVSPTYIESGREETTQDVVAAISSGQLDRIERGIAANSAKLDEILRRLGGGRPPGPEGELGLDLGGDQPKTGSPGQTDSLEEADEAEDTG